MTKKDFVAVAAVIKRIECERTRHETALMLAAVFAELNPRFNRERFYRACNI